MSYSRLQFKGDQYNTLNSDQQYSDIKYWPQSTTNKRLVDITPFRAINNPMKREKLQTFLISINSQQSIFNYFYKQYRDVLDGDFLAPRVQPLDNSSCGSSDTSSQGEFEQRIGPRKLKAIKIHTSSPTR